MDVQKTALSDDVAGGPQGQSYDADPLDHGIDVSGRSCTQAFVLTPELEGLAQRALPGLVLLDGSWPLLSARAWPVGSLLQRRCNTHHPIPHWAGNRR